MNRNTSVALGVVVAIALFLGGVAVGATVVPRAGGVAASPSPTTNAQGFRRGAGGASGATGALGGQNQAVVGRVLSVNDGSITVEVRGQGGTTTSQIVLVGANTRVVRASETEVKLADVKPDEQVQIVGSADTATGTISANAIVVGGNALQQLFGGPGARGASGASPRPSGSPR